MKKILWMLLALSTLSLTACGDDDDNSPAIDVPAQFMTALTQHYPEARNVEWEVRGNYRVAEFTLNRKSMDVWFNSSATWVMTKTELNRSLLSLPEAVATAFAGGEYGTWTIDDIDYYQRPDRDFYVIEVENPGQPDTDLFYNTDGSFIKASNTNHTDIFPDTAI